MGSFDITCAISGFPISDGEPVRALLLTQNPYHRGLTAGHWTCEVHGHWFPRTFPLRGKYADYGRVAFTTKGLQQEAWIRGFDIDLVEHGWGENSVHDVSVEKGKLDMERIHEAIWNGRLHVRREVRDMWADLRLTDPGAAKVFEDEAEPRPRHRLHESVPTRKRVQRMLVAANMQMYEGSYGKPGLLVDRVDAASVRVRAHTVGADADEDLKLLNKAREILSARYAVMLTSGAHSYRAELLVRPHPYKDRYPAAGDGIIPVSTKEKNRAPLAIGTALIREDVWQAMLDSNRSRLASLLQDVHELCKPAKIEGLDFEGLDTPSTRAMRRLLGHSAMNSNRAMFGGIPFTVGLETSWNYVTLSAELGRERELGDFFQTVAETVFVCSYMHTIRYQWRPSSTVGPQFAEWGPHAAFSKAMLRIASKAHEAEVAQRKKWEAEMEPPVKPKKR